VKLSHVPADGVVHRAVPTRIDRPAEFVGSRRRAWGENRIAGELAKLGWRVSPRTVAKYRPKHLQRGRGQSWRTFLRNHASEVCACDFFTLVTVHFQTLYAFVVVFLKRRVIAHVAVTAHPTGAWVAQRMVEAVGAAPPRYLLHDRDSIYDPRAPGGDAPSRLPRSRTRLQRAPTPSASCTAMSAITTAARIASCAPTRPRVRGGSCRHEALHPMT
jgi:hypothetical protein